MNGPKQPQQQEGSPLDAVVEKAGGGSNAVIPEQKKVADHLQEREESEAFVQVHVPEAIAEPVGQPQQPQPHPTHTAVEIGIFERDFGEGKVFAPRVLRDGVHGDDVSVLVTVEHVQTVPRALGHL